MSDGSLYLEDVIEETGITERNVKYWSQKYDLPIEKDGRRNVYPQRTLTLLRLIKSLSETDFFTHHFIRLQVQRALGFNKPEMDKQDEYREVRQRGRDILNSVKSAVGSEILPSLEGTGKDETEQSERRRRVRSGGDLDEDIL